MMRGLSQQQICECFNTLFGTAFNVQLHGGGAEPDYLPPAYAQSGPMIAGRIVAREDFAASALHEAAHWCVASQRQRRLPDYGYAYIPPPRGAPGQAQFFVSEQRTQATECYLARRAGVSFSASADDPDFCLVAVQRFQDDLHARVERWEDVRSPECAPPRAIQLGQALGFCLAALGAADGQSS